MIGTALQLIPWVMKLLQGAGVIKDPEHERELRLKIIDVASQERVAESRELIDFVKATSPDSAHVWPFINSIQALTRPGLTWIVMGSIIASFWVEGVSARITQTLSAFSSAGTAGLLFLAIPAWWFFGRTAERLVPGLALFRGAAGGHVNGGNGDNGEAPRASGPAPKASGPAQAHRDDVRGGLE